METGWQPYNEQRMLLVQQICVKQGEYLTAELQKLSTEELEVMRDRLCANTPDAHTLLVRRQIQELAAALPKDATVTVRNLMLMLSGKRMVAVRTIRNAPEKLEPETDICDDRVERERELNPVSSAVS